ncbi:MAG TPA: DUF4383 domain-containing protein [Alphaproteobacteria bacterium]|nr:DUF4383 domain-containing protein [Alphaproteobacteria bacterium]
MQTRYFALIFGIAYIVAAAAGIIPGLLVRSPDLPPLTVDALYGRALGLFPVNVLHTLVHLVIGLWGVIAWRSFAQAQLYARSLAIIYGVLTILGVIPATSTMFGLVPLFGHDIWLHAGTALIAAYFGWFAERRAATDSTSALPR